MPQDPPPPRPGPFTCRVVREAVEAALIEAAGEIDLATRGRLHAALEPLLDDERPLLLDLSQVTFIDCSGLRVLQTAGAKHRRFAVVAPSMAVTRLLELSGAQVTVFASVDEAIRELASDPPL